MKLTVTMILLLLASLAFGQSTVISGQVTDTGNIPWGNGAYTVTFVGPSNAHWNGGTFPNNPITGTLNSTGAFSVSVPSNDQINPPGTQWSLKVCSATVPQTCYSTALTLTGATLSLATMPAAVVITVPTTPTMTTPVIAYDDSEISGGWVGFVYYNLAVGAPRVCQAVTARQCVAWASIGGSPTPPPALTSMLSVAPSALPMGTAQQGTPTGPVTLGLTSSGTGPVTVSSITVTGPNAADFTGNTAGCQITLPSTVTCPIAFTFTPSTGGPESATVTITSNATTPVIVVPLTGTGTPTPTFTLTIAPASSNTGSGSVQSGDGVTCAPGDSTCTPVAPTINCLINNNQETGSCSFSYPSGTGITLTETPALGNVFVAVSGGGCVTNPCTFNLTGNTTVSAAFNAVPVNYTLALTGVDQGIGTVTDDTGALNCTSTAGVLSGTCNASFPQGTVVNLTATPSASCTGGACTWKSWGGVSCATASCPVTMTGNTSVSVDFAQPAGGNPVVFNQVISGGTPGGASLAFVKACNNFVSGAGTSTTVTCAIAAGDNACMFASEGSSFTATFTVSDSAGVTWTQTSSGYSHNGNSPAVRHGMFCLANSATALSSVTINWSTSVSFTLGIVLEFSGGASSGFEDASVNSDSNSVAVTSLTSGALTTTNANDVLIFCDRTDGDGGGFTVGSGYTLDANASASTRGMCQYKIVAATQTGVTTSSSWVNAKSAGSIFGGFKASGASSTVTGTWPSATAQGDLNVCLIDWNDATTTVSSITDTKGNSYAQVGASPKVGTGLTEAMYYAQNVAAAGAGANTITVALSASPTVKKLNCADYSGPLTVGALDTSIGATGTSAAPSTGNLTTATTNELLVGGVNASTVISASSPLFTSRTSTTTNDLEDRAVTAVGAYGFTPSLSSSGNWAALLAAFKTNGAVTTYAVNIGGAGTGNGTVTGSGLNCTITAGVASGTCGVSVLSGATLNITATPQSGHSFGGYTGGGCGAPPNCLTNAITANTNITATFSLPVSGGPFNILNQQSVLNRPYPSAYYNQKLPGAGSGGPTGHLMANSDTMMASIMQSGAATDAGAWNSPGSDDGQHKPLYYGQSTDPVYQLNGCVSPESGLNGIKFHAPSGAQFNQGSFDKEIVIWDQTTNQTVGLFGGTCTSANCFALPACSGTLSAPCSFTVNGGYCSADNWVSGSGVGGGDAVSTAGLSPFGNIIRMTEITTIHHINHGLRLIDLCSGTDSGAYASRTVFPSNQTGGTGANPCTATGTAEPRPPNGALIFADYTQAQLDCFDPTKGACGGVTKLTATQFALVEALTLYGGTTEDTGGGESIRVPGIESEQAYYFYDTNGYSGAKAIAQNFETYMGTSTGAGQCGSPWCTVTTRSSPHSVYQWNLTWAGISSQGGKAFWQHLHIADPCVAIAMQGQANDGHGTNACP